jgi:hypothetical protein
MCFHSIYITTTIGRPRFNSCLAVDELLLYMELINRTIALVGVFLPVQSTLAYIYVFACLYLDKCIGGCRKRAGDQETTTIGESSAFSKAAESCSDHDRYSEWKLLGIIVVDCRS